MGKKRARKFTGVLVFFGSLLAWKRSMSFVILIRLNEEVDATSGHQFNSQPQVYVALRFSSLSPFSKCFLFFYFIYTVARKVGAPRELAQDSALFIRGLILLPIEWIELS